MANFSENDIVVSTKQSTFTCGAIKAYVGAIMKIIDPKPDVYKDVEVYKSKKDELHKNSSFVPVKDLRLANASEQLAYEQGIRNISNMQ